MRDIKELQLAIDEGRGVRLDDGTIITSMDDLGKIDAPVKNAADPAKPAATAPKADAPKDAPKK